jgi:hypothetical protein
MMHYYYYSPCISLSLFGVLSCLKFWMIRARLLFSLKCLLFTPHAQRHEQQYKKNDYVSTLKKRQMRKNYKIIKLEKEKKE